MFCSKCGSELPENAQFCPKCGAETGISGKDNGKTANGGGNKNKMIIAGVVACLLLFVFYGLSLKGRTVNNREFTDYGANTASDTEIIEDSQMESADDFRFEYHDDGTASVIGIIHRGETMSIPSEVSYMGETYSVTEIGEKVFVSHRSLKSVEIPYGVTKIGEFAFSGCESLASIEIPDSVTEIERCAFQRCISLTSVKIPYGVTEIGGNAFAGCVSLTSIEIADSVTKIGSGAFNGCRSLTNVEIPDSVTEIEGDAFSTCTSLERVEMGSETNVNYTAFEDCPNLHGNIIRR